MTQHSVHFEEDKDDNNATVTTATPTVTGDSLLLPNEPTSMTQHQLLKYMAMMQKQHKTLMHKLEQVGLSKSAPLDLTQEKDEIKEKEAVALPTGPVELPNTTFKQADKRHKAHLKATRPKKGK